MIDPLYMYLPASTVKRIARISDLIHEAEAAGLSVHGDILINAHEIRCNISGFDVSWTGGAFGLGMYAIRGDGIHGAEMRPSSAEVVDVIMALKGEVGWTTSL